MAAESRANGSMSEVELVRALLAINSAADARARVGSDRPSQRGRPVAAALCLCWQARQNGHVSPKNSSPARKSDLSFLRNIPAPVLPPCDMSDSASIGLATNRVQHHTTLTVRGQVAALMLL